MIMINHKNKLPNKRNKKQVTSLIAIHIDNDDVY